MIRRAQVRSLPGPSTPSKSPLRFLVSCRSTVQRCVGFWNGIVRIGELDGEIDAIERQSDAFSVTIDRADDTSLAGAREVARVRAKSSGTGAYMNNPTCLTFLPTGRAGE
jgi:hypothetical protein